ncbi:hypothetical protein [Skermanella aerolata]|uniref:hypothetical protein n=1 Tax=Skermanella aerolata TaxID=393310 RepID=UPI0011BFE308|nr:hypothetical protein [Skermanella aerolata]
MQDGIIAFLGFGRRELPLYPNTAAALGDYLRRDDRPSQPPNAPGLLVSTAGSRLLYGNLQITFHRLVGRTGLTSRSILPANRGN